MLLGLQQAPALTSVTLAWDPSSSPAVTGYKVYYGVGTGAYTNAVSAGAATNATVTGLVPGITYFFAATAVDAAGQESDYSTEISDVTTAPSNQPPTISTIANQSTTQDTATGAIPFTIADPDTTLASLTLSGTSSDTSLVANNRIVFSGNGANRTVRITPQAGQSGSANITVTVSDGTSTATSTFLLTINSSRPLNTPPSISAIADQVTTPDTATATIAFTVSDKDTAASALTLSGTSSDTSLVPNANIVFGGSGGNRTLVVLPVNGATGSAEITITVSDGSATTDSIFLLTVSTNVFTPAVASYSGLFYDSNQVQVASAGSIKVTTTTKKAYSGRISNQGHSYSITGQLDNQGRGSNYIKRPMQSPLILNFDCGTSNSQGVAFGTLKDSDWSAVVSADKAVFNSRTNPAPCWGTYTLILPGQTNDNSTSKGYSYGVAHVQQSGLVSFAGRLADGTRVSQGTFLSKDGMWPFYTSLYSSHGLVLSWLGVTTNITGNIPNITGTASWIKLPNSLANYYSTGFTNECNAAGSVYHAPTNINQHVVFLNNARLHFRGGNLPGDFINSVALGTSSRIINESTNSLSMSFSLSTGTFSGWVRDPDTRKIGYFGGAVLQRFNAGYGMLLGTNMSSAVELTP